MLRPMIHPTVRLSVMLRAKTVRFRHIVGPHAEVEPTGGGQDGLDLEKFTSYIHP